MESALDISPYMPLFYGVIISTALFGITTLQFWVYGTANKDGWTMRSVVALLCVTSTTVSIMDVLVLRQYLVRMTSDPLALTQVTPEMAAILPLTALIVFIVDMFFAVRVYLLKQVHLTVVAFIALTATACFILGIVSTVEVFRNPTIENLSTKSNMVEVGVTNGLSALSELAAAIALCWSLMTVRTGVQSTDSILQKLFKWSISRGLLLTIVQIVALIVYVVNPQSLNWMPFQMSLNKVYIITMMSMLNSRPEIRRDFVKASSGSHTNSSAELTRNFQFTTPTQLRTEYEGDAIQTISVVEEKDTRTPQNHIPHPMEMV